MTDCSSPEFMVLAQGGAAFSMLAKAGFMLFILLGVFLFGFIGFVSYIFCSTQRRLRVTQRQA